MTYSYVLALWHPGHEENNNNEVLSVHPEREGGWPQGRKQGRKQARQQARQQASKATGGRKS